MRRGARLNPSSADGARAGTPNLAPKFARFATIGTSPCEEAVRAASVDVWEPFRLSPEPHRPHARIVYEDEGTVRRLGATRSESVNVTIVAAANENLQAAMHEKRFPADLHSRVAVLSLELLPLRVREGDIELLAERFLAAACTEYGIPPKTLGDDARAALRGHAWPENVRELRNVMQRVALEFDGFRISAEGLGLSAGDVSIAPEPRGGAEHGRPSACSTP